MLGRMITAPCCNEALEGRKKQRQATMKLWKAEAMPGNNETLEDREEAMPDINGNLQRTEKGMA